MERKSQTTNLALRVENSEFDRKGKKGCNYVEVLIEQKNGGESYVLFTVEYDFCEYEVECNVHHGEPTYVPYGSTSVMYDNGIEIEVDVSTAFDDVDERLYIEDIDETIAIDKSKAIKILGCSEEEFEDALKKARKLCLDEIHALAEEYYQENPICDLCDDE